MRTGAATLVGRADEIAAFDAVTTGLGRGAAAVVELTGEPGIGKTRLLADVAARAQARGLLVVSGSASELEQDLPFAVLVDALDAHLADFDVERCADLGVDARTQLAHMFPALSAVAAEGAAASQHERYRAHAAVRSLLACLARVRPVVLVLDDLHWADSASIELLGALVRRPPSTVIMALAFRPRQVPQRLTTALERAHRTAALTRIELEPLTLVEARAFLGDAVDPATSSALYRDSGGNPFYLDQLARSLDRAQDDRRASVTTLPGVRVPAAVTASLREELDLLSPSTRLALDAAAVAGDPFDPELAAAAAELPETAVLDAVDELLRLDLIRSTDVARRFRFRHPIVRRAVYEATPAGWRLGAHARCASALAARGATAAVRAHHVERSAREGDIGSVAVLREAGDTTVRLAPASAAHWYAHALRILPRSAPASERVAVLRARAEALTATGEFTESFSALQEALAIVPNDAHATYVALSRTCAQVEGLLGRHHHAHDRLANTLAGLSDPGSPDAVALMIDLAMNGFWRASYEEMQEAAQRAASTARPLADPPLAAAALAVLALADSMVGAAERADTHRTQAAALVESLTDEALAQRLDAATWLAGAELYLDRYADADAHADRALIIGRATGQGQLFLVLVQILGRVWFVRGKAAEAVDLLEGGIEAARTLGNTQALVWNLFNRSAVALAVGDIATALATARESVDLSVELAEGFHSAWAALRLAGALLETGQPQPAVDVLVASAGGDELVRIPGSWRAYGLELLTRCRLTLDRPADAEHAAACAQAWAHAVQLPMAGAWADRATAAVALAAGDPGPAAERALASAAVAEDVGAPIEAALSRTLAGRALAQAGQAEHAVAQLQRAAAELDACGALRYRAQAERELRKLGHHIHRRTRPGTADGSPIESLTERERQVTQLVVDRKTNPEIAAELFLSKKTVETHLRNIFRKMGVSTRVALARAAEHAAGPDRGP